MLVGWVFGLLRCVDSPGSADPCLLVTHAEMVCAKALCETLVVSLHARSHAPFAPCAHASRGRLHNRGRFASTAVMCSCLYACSGARGSLMACLTLRVASLPGSKSCCRSLPWQVLSCPASRTRSPFSTATYCLYAAGFHKLC
jgi:hypothetical protein